MSRPRDDSKLRQLIFYGSRPESILQGFPIAKFRDEIAQARQSDLELAAVDETELLVLKLLEFFKNSCFKWIDNYICDHCQQSCRPTGTGTGTPMEQTYFAADRVELYHCDPCRQPYRFPRINDPNKLMISRIGRCGEWAIAFTALLHCLNVDVRIVFANFDHVWCEYYNRTQQRWIHIDPCENVHDNPFMYQTGWGRQVTHCHAMSKYEVRDVTWRYTSAWEKTLQDRKSIIPSEPSTEEHFRSANQRLQASLRPEVTKEMNLRWLCELGQFLVIGDQVVDDKAKQGRSSGSLMWRMQRLEVGSEQGPSCSTTVSQAPRFVFRFGRSDAQLQTGNAAWSVKYYAQKDLYKFDDKSISGWNGGLAFSDNVFRNVEHDWKMVYLSRTKNCPPEAEGLLEWAFLPTSGRPWTRARVRIEGQEFHAGKIELSISFCKAEDYLANRKSALEDGVKFRPGQEVEFKKIDMPEGCDCFVVRARMLGGNGNDAWQHAQIFRASSVDQQIISSMDVSVFF